VLVGVEAHGERCSRRSGEDIPDDLAVDSARDAVLQLQVHLGDRVLGEDRGVRDVTYAGILSVHQFPVCSFTPESSFSVSVAQIRGWIGLTYGWRRTQPCCGW
jgi:hypothetical protein